MQSFVGALIYTLLGLVTAKYVEYITDQVIPNKNMNLMTLLGVLMIIILLVRHVLSYLYSLFSLFVAQNIDARLILGYYKYILHLPQSFFDGMRTGEIISRINDAVKVRQFLNEGFIGIILNIFIVIFSFILMYVYNWKMALIATFIIPIYALLYWIFNRYNKKYLRKLMETSAELESQLVESITAVRTIKRLHLFEMVNFKTEQRFINLLKLVKNTAVFQLMISTLQSFITGVFTTAMLWVGTSYVVKVELTPGELFSFYAIINYFIGPVASLVSANKMIQDASIASDRLFEIMELDADESEQDAHQLIEAELGDISFKNVSFAYGGRLTLFDNISFTIPQKSITLILGESGSGKSSVAHLLQKMYPLKQGAICVQDLDIKHVSKKSLSKWVSVVPQQVELFSDTVLNNITLDDFSVDMKKVVNICQELELHDFIEKLPNGYQTVLAENGFSLSGGQRQRLAVARMLYREPKVIILDEATSSLDVRAEEKIFSIMRRLKTEGCTILIITHRLQVVKQADKIIFLDNGKVAGEGSHNELILHNKSYKKLLSKIDI